MTHKKNSMRVLRNSILKLIAAAAVLGSATSAFAQSQFASFTQADPNFNLPFRMVNTGTTTSKFGLIDSTGAELTTTYSGVTFRSNTYSGSGTGILVNFQYQSAANGYGAGVGENIPALMRMFTVVNGTAVATPIPPFGTFDQQAFKNVFISFTAIAPAPSGASGTNLLTVAPTYTAGVTPPPINGFSPGNTNPNSNTTNGSTASLTGFQGSSTASFSATESSTGGNYVGYTSDFLDFLNKTYTNRNYSISLANVQPTFNVGPNAPGNPNSSDYLQNFVSSAGGTFGSNPSPFIPEPGTFALFAPGVGLAVAFLRRRRG